MTEKLTICKEPLEQRNLAYIFIILLYLMINTVLQAELVA